MDAICEELVDLARRIKFEDLPPEVIKEAGRRILDALGCMAGGITGLTSQQAIKATGCSDGAQESSIIGTSYRTSCEKATLVNCTSLRFLDYMDGHVGTSPSHVCFNIPPILAVGERTRANGRQLVNAVVVAYEIMPRFQECLPGLSERGWAGGTNLEFSVPLAIAPLLGLNHQQTIDALAISITHGNALNVSSRGQMPPSKTIVDGMTAMNAVVSTLLAQQGITGPHNAIEGPGGFAAAVAGSIDYDQLLAPIGRYKILNTSTKWHNTVKCGRSAVAAVLQLLKEHNIKFHDIDGIQIGLGQTDFKHQTRYLADGPSRPRSRDAANHSVRYGVAAAIVEGELGPDQYEPEKLQLPQIMDLLDRTSVYHEAAHDAYLPAASPATIKLSTANGQELSHTVIFAPGHPKNPISDEALEEKFRRLARKVLDHGQIEAVIAATRDMADLADVRMLTRLTRPDTNQEMPMKE